MIFESQLWGRFGRCLLTAFFALAATNYTHATVMVGLVDFDGMEMGLTSYHNDALVGGGISTNGNLAFNEQFVLFNSSGDAFNPMSRASLSPREADGGQVGMPFAVSDDSVVAATGNSVFPADEQGFAGEAKEDGFFGMTDNDNSDNPGGLNTAEFVFDISGFSDLSIAMDFAAMGSFDIFSGPGSVDFLGVDYDIDGNGFSPLFVADVDIGSIQSYSMDSGTPVDLPDPLFIKTTVLNDNFQTLTANISGTGSSLTVRVQAILGGSSESVGFDNLTIRGVPEPTSISLLTMAGFAVLAGLRRRGRLDTYSPRSGW